MQIDLELALVNATENEIKDFQDNLPDGFYVEDRSDKNWGFVIRTIEKPSEDFSTAINNFLEPLNSLSGLVRSCSSILRVGVFYDTATCTMRLNSYDQLTLFKASIEITVYPFSDEE
jgi:hypothetical protein